MVEEIIKKYFRNLSGLWSLTQFGHSELSEYAERLMFHNTRRGIVTLGIVTLLLLGSAAVIYILLDFDSIYIYSCSLLALLSLHMAISARAIQDTRVLHLLGITLLVVIGVTFVLVAHQTGSFNSALFASVILLFLVMPLVPWGLGEAVLIILLVYLVFTFSTLSVEGRFDSETLWMLQFVMLAAGLTTLIVIGNTVSVRKDDIQARYELESARHRMELLSLKDPLTGAWNRRFLEQKFTEIIFAYQKNDQGFHFALIDVDNFKYINDSQGHEYGDLVLSRLTVNFLAQFSGDEYLIRMGGDEFAILFSGDDPESLIERSTTALQSDPELVSASATGQIHVSTGLVSLDKADTGSLNAIYRQADIALYDAKSRKSAEKRNENMVHKKYFG